MKYSITKYSRGILNKLVNKTGFVANSKYKIKALFKDFQGPKLHFSSTKIIDKKPYSRHGHSKFRLQCDTEVYCTQQYRNDKSKWQIVYKCKISKFARFKFKDFQVLSSTLSVFKHFQGPWSFYSKFKNFQGFLKHAMNPGWTLTRTTVMFLGHY